MPGWIRFPLSDFSVHGAPFINSKPDQLICVKGLDGGHPQTVRSEAQYRGRLVPLGLQVEHCQIGSAEQGYACTGLCQKKASTANQHHRIIPDLIRVWLPGCKWMIDPPRPEAIAHVHACRHAGIQVKRLAIMLTAGAIARTGLNQTDEVRAFTGQKLGRMNSQNSACRRSGCGFAPGRT